MIMSMRSFKHGTFFFLEGGGGQYSTVITNSSGLCIQRSRLDRRKHSCPDKSGVSEVDSCAAQMSLNNIQGHSYKVSDQIINYYEYMY